MEEYEVGVDALKKERTALREELRKTKEKLGAMETVIKTMPATTGDVLDEESPAYKHRMDALTKQASADSFANYLSICIQCPYPVLIAIQLSLKDRNVGAEGVKRKSEGVPCRIAT
jgi:hypothetical protein